MTSRSNRLLGPGTRLCVQPESHSHSFFSGIKSRWSYEFSTIYVIHHWRIEMDQGGDFPPPPPPIKILNNNVTDDLLNYELSIICDWFGANKLALNVSRTKFMVFHTA